MEMCIRINSESIPNRFRFPDFWGSTQRYCLHLLTRSEGDSSRRNNVHVAIPSILTSPAAPKSAHLFFAGASYAPFSGPWRRSKSIPKIEHVQWRQKIWTWDIFENRANRQNKHAHCICPHYVHMYCACPVLLQVCTGFDKSLIPRLCDSASCPRKLVHATWEFNWTFAEPCGALKKLLDAKSYLP